MGLPNEKAITAEDKIVPFPVWAYNKIYNEYYRDENLMDEVKLTEDHLRFRCWEKDYFTSALPWQQRGNTIALPITGQAIVDFNIPQDEELLGHQIDVFPSPNPYIDATMVGSQKASGYGAANARTGSTLTNGLKNLTTDNTNTLLNDYNTIDLSSVTATDIADLRAGFQVQKWLERNARCGVRYNEFLKTHYGTAPRDERLQRPEYIGGARTPELS